MIHNFCLRLVAGFFMFFPPAPTVAPAPAPQLTTSHTDAQLEQLAEFVLKHPGRKKDALGPSGSKLLGFEAPGVVITYVQVISKDAAGQLVTHQASVGEQDGVKFILLGTIDGKVFISTRLAADGRYVKGFRMEHGHAPEELDTQAGKQFATDERLFWSPLIVSAGVVSLHQTS